MSGPLLQHPEWLAPALLALAAATALLALAWRRARRRGRALLGPRAPRPAVGRDALLLLALAALGLALLGPRIGQRSLRIAASGVDVALVLDVSRSMTAPDNPPSRLHRARRAAGGVLARLGAGDRAALAAFAGHGVLLTPLSVDKDALAEMLPLLDPTLMQAGGSSLGDGIRAALEAFARDGTSRPRVLLVLGDGEDPARAGAGDAAAAAARAGVRIVTLGFGSEAGAGLPEGDGWLRDARGRSVVSRRDAAVLRRLAETSDGAAFEADRWGEADLDALVAALRRDASPLPGQLVERRVDAVRVAPFAALAFALLALEAAGRRRAGRHLIVSIAGLALAGAGLPAAEEEIAPPALEELEARLRAHPGDARSLLWLGLARAGRGRHDEAARAFAAAALSARDPALAGLAYYDLGVTALARGDLEAARDAFFDAVALAPADRRAVYNLEWTLAALAQRPPEPPPEPDPAPQERRPEPREREPADEPPPLTPEEARRWLEAVGDDPGRALRAAAGRAGEARPPTRGPAW